MLFTHYWWCVGQMLFTHYLWCVEQMLFTHYWWCVGQIMFTHYWWCVGQMTKHHKNKFPVVIPLQKYFYNLYRILFRMSLERFQMRALQRLVINETTGVFALELHEQNSFHQMFKMSAAALSTYVSKWQKLFKTMDFWFFSVLVISLRRWFPSPSLDLVMSGLREKQTGIFQINKLHTY